MGDKSQLAVHKIMANEGVLDKLGDTNKFMKKALEVNINDNKSKIHNYESRSGFPYKKRQWISDAEKKFYKYLKKNIYKWRDIEIFCKVRIGDIADLDDELTYNRNDYFKIACKHVDYLIVDKESLDIICVVELDDFTHDRNDRVERDQFVACVMQSINIPYIRVKEKVANINRFTLNSINNVIAEYYKPKCPVCGRNMIVRTPSITSRKKEMFYACEDNRKCRKTITIEVED